MEFNPMILNQTHFEPRCAEMTDAELAFASTDVRACLEIWRDEKPHNDPTMQKWWAEFDAITAERQKRRTA